MERATLYFFLHSYSVLWGLIDFVTFSALFYNLCHENDLSRLLCVILLVFCTTVTFIFFCIFDWLTPPSFDLQASEDGRIHGVDTSAIELLLKSSQSLYTYNFYILLCTFNAISVRYLLQNKMKILTLHSTMKNCFHTEKEWKNHALGLRFQDGQNKSR